MIRTATELLLLGARADTDYFEDNELTSRPSLGVIVDLLQDHAVDAYYAALLKALTSSGSTTLFTNRGMLVTEAKKCRTLSWLLR